MTSEGAQRVQVVRVGTRRELGLLIGVGLIVTLVIGVGAVFAARSLAYSQALADSERMTERLAELVKPLWTGYQSRDADDVRTWTREIDTRLQNGNLTHVAVWSADGAALFDSDAGLAVTDVPDPGQLRAALAGETTGDFEDQSAGDRSVRFAEVYTLLGGDGQSRVVLEAHYKYDSLDRLAGRLLRQALPLVLVPLLLLELTQISIAISLARRVQRHETERSQLLQQALDASDRERVRFAADLHDGPIQDLAGISYALGAIAPTVVERHAPLMARVQDALQRAIESLRGLMTDLYPPDLHSGNLGQAVTDLAQKLREEHVEVVLDLAEVPALGEEAAAALYRVARESLANVVKHAQATTVRISLGVVDHLRGSDQPWVRLVVADDGVGLDPAKLDRRAEGHLGLRLLVDRVHTLGGELVVTSAAGQGTTVRAEIPVTSPSAG